MQKRLSHIGWSDKNECEACHKEEGTDTHRLHHCLEWHDVRREIPDACRKWAKRYCDASSQ